MDVSVRHGTHRKRGEKVGTAQGYRFRHGSWIDPGRGRFVEINGAIVVGQPATVTYTDVGGIKKVTIISAVPAT